jgi:hypothetical protein
MLSLSKHLGWGKERFFVSLRMTRNSEFAEVLVVR